MKNKIQKWSYHCGIMGKATEYKSGIPFGCQFESSFSKLSGQQKMTSIWAP